MTDFIFPAPATPALAIAGSDALFPIRRVFCVGRNYSAHAREMGHDPDREPPFFFDKPADAVVSPGKIPFPPGTDDLHHEVEMVVALHRGGRDIKRTDALDCVFGYAIGNDLTRRDIQAEAKKAGRPWTMAKGFDASAVCGPVHPADTTGHLSHGAVSSTVNGELRQKGDLADMIWPVPDMIAFLSGLIELKPGDLIYTGTPAGVGKLVPGDSCVLAIEGLGEITHTIV